jgi:serine phosphatase RsbU (regulator of sigma subunit)
LKEDETVLGRHPECGVHLESNMVSRKHARVLREGRDHFLEDMGSGNGTTVNGQRIADKTLLRHEDRIKLGPMLLRFEDPNAAAKGSSAGMQFTKRPDHDATFAFQLDLSSDEEDASTIMSSLGGASGYGALEVRPEVKLKGILEISRSLAGTLDLQKLLPKILETLFNMFPQADRGCILLKDDASGHLLPRAIKHRRADQDESVKLSRTILNKVLQEKTGILSADAANDARFNASESISNFTIRSMMCVPMLGLDGNPMGVINVDTQNPLNQFQKDDLDLLMAVAGQAALSYESARLLVTYMEKQKQDNEMNIARNVQRALLPEQLPTVEGYDFFASYEAAQAVGGDYYDCLPLAEERKVCLAFGDVAGKGVPASLVMSRLSSVVQSTLDFVHEAGAAVERINNHMCANAVEGRFVTFVLVIIDLATHEMSIVNAGHMAPMIRRTDGSVEEFGEELVGLPLGVAEGFPFDVARRTLAPGEVVVIYTDGVSEAMNPQSELYGTQRIQKLIAKNPPDAAQIGTVILADVKKHANGRPQNDDITLMAFGRRV